MVPSVLGELLTLLNYQGAEHPIWIGDVFGRDKSQLLYHCGQYYLHPECYVIATRTPTRYVSTMCELMAGSKMMSLDGLDLVELHCTDACI